MKMIGNKRLVKILRKNGEEKDVEYNKDGCIINLKKDDSLYFYCVDCKKYTSKKGYSFRDLGLNYHNLSIKDLFCRECNIKNTTKKKYGVDNISQLEKTKKKKSETMLRNFGTDKSFKLPSYLDFLKENGVDNISQLKQVKEKKQNITNVKYDKIVRNYLKEINIELVGKYKPQRPYDIKDTVYTFRCLNCGNIFKHALHSRKPRCYNCFPREYTSSKYEEEICDYLDMLNVDYKRNDRSIISPYEIDILIPSKKIAIEIDGLYWHNYEKVGKYYHLEKTKKCENQGFVLIHIFENDWINRKDFTKKIIYNKIYNNINKYHGDIIKIDKRFYSSLEFPKYKTIRTEEPRRYYIDKRNISFSYLKTNAIIFDCGAEVLKYDI